MLSPFLSLGAVELETALLNNLPLPSLIFLFLSGSLSRIFGPVGNDCAALGPFGMSEDMAFGPEGNGKSNAAGKTAGFVRIGESGFGLLIGEGGLLCVVRAMGEADRRLAVRGSFRSSSFLRTSSLRSDSSLRLRLSSSVRSSLRSLRRSGEIRLLESGDLRLSGDFRLSLRRRSSLDLLRRRSFGSRSTDLLLASRIGDRLRLDSVLTGLVSSLGRSSFVCEDR